jgi:hypothetical protein
MLGERDFSHGSTFGGVINCIFCHQIDRKIPTPALMVARRLILIPRAQWIQISNALGVDTTMAYLDLQFKSRSKDKLLA